MDGQREAESKTSEIRKRIEEKVIAYFDLIGNMKLELSADDADCDLSYISAKLARCSSFMEQMSDIQYEMTRIDLHVTSAARSQKLLVQEKERELKASKGYASEDREKKAHWLHLKLVHERQDAEDWTTLAHLVLEVREAILKKIEMTKRLESSIRLQQKILEAKVSSGATSLNGPLPRKSVEGVGELDL